ncbi:MAG: glycosyltransferase family 4 protein [Desulfomonilia bacterium]|jgi:glycosyltransferase involved in cell wall biosynthesis
MKVCVLTTSFPLGKGDISGMFVLEKCRHLAKQGIKVRVITPHYPGAPLNEVIDGIEVRRFRYFFPETLQKLCYGSGIPNNIREFPWTRVQLPILLALFTIQAIIHARDCDVVNAHWSIAGLAGFIAAKLYGKPIVLFMHQGTTRSLSKIEKILLEQVDYVICNSSYTQSHVLKSAQPKRIKIIPPSVDITKFQPHIMQEEDKNLLPEKSRDKFIIFSLGRLVEWKGHTYLIDAISLMNEVPLPHLLIGGEGTLYQELTTKVQKMNLSDRVTFLGHIPGNLISKYFSLADIYVQPSIIDRDGTTEGLGVTLLEAMACEKPCIGSRVGGILDIIKDGENGFLVDPADPTQLAESITILLRDERLRREMGKNARRFVENNYSWDTKAKELIEIYKNLIVQK